MLKFQNHCAQGDLYMRRIAMIPSTATPLAAENGNYIVAHSETGHHHVIAERQNVTLYSDGDPMVSYLQVIAATDQVETLLEHLRGHDTHETISIPPGNYEILRQREYVPEGWRRVAD